MPAISDLLTGGRTAEFAPGDYLFRTGEPAEHFYVIEHGAVALELVGGGRPHLIETLHDGEVAGFSWLFEPRRWLFDARAVEATTATAYEAGEQRLTEDVLRHFAAIAVNRLQATRLQLLDVYGRGG